MLSSVQFIHSVVSNSLRPHESQQARPPCPSPSPGVHSNSCPSSWWWHPAISSSVAPFSSCLQSLPSSESFPMSQFFAWGGQSTGDAQLCPFLWHAMDLSILGFPVHHQLLEPSQTHGHWVSDMIQHLISCCPLLLLPSIFPRVRVFFNESVLCIQRCPKYWSFNFSISPSNEFSGLISFRIDWVDLLVVQGTLMSILQHYSWKASIVQHSVFFTAQLSHPYVTTRKTIALIRWTFVYRAMYLLFNMLSRFVIAFIPKTNCLLISWLQSPSAVILEPKKIKTLTVSIVSPSICHEVMGSVAMILVFLFFFFFFFHFFVKG